MVHGNPTWSYYFRHLVTLFRKTHRVIVLDHMGCGLSDKPQDYSYTLANHIENMTALLKHLQINSYSMVVHDWGGAIGFGYAVKNIRYLRKIVVLNTAAFRSSRIPLRIQFCRLPVVGEIIVRLFNGFAWPATFMAVKKKMTPEIVRAYLAPYDSWKNRVAIYRFVRDIPLHSSHQSYSTLVDIEKKLALLRDAKIPLLLLWGGSDFCFNDTFYDEWLKRFPECQAHYFNNGGHYILEDKQEEITPLVESFFAR